MNLEALLLAIAIVESADAKHPLGNDDAVGKAGERSRYQIKEETWALYSPRPFTTARYYDEARSTARSIVMGIVHRLPEKHANNEWWIAYAWNRGIAGTLLDIKAEKPRQPWSDYATRVSNTYEDLMTVSETNRVKGKR